MDIIWEELTSGLPDTRQLVHVLIRLIAAAVLGVAVGLGSLGVALLSTFFTLVILSLAGRFEHQGGGNGARNN